MNSSDIKPGRPLGLTLAILLSVLLYAVMPLLLLGYRLLVQDRLSRVDAPVVFESRLLLAATVYVDALVPVWDSRFPFASYA